MMTLPHSRPRFRDSERGGITIVIALVLIVLMSLAAFSLSRNSIRQLASSGSILQGGKASEASDAGLDWFVVWTSKENRELAYYSGSPSANKSLATAFYDLTKNLDASGVNPAWYQNLSNDGLLASTDPARAWDMAFAIRSDESQSATSDMVFNNNATGVLQAGNSTGNPVVQRFDVVARYLGGTGSNSQTSTTTSGAGGTNANAPGFGDLLFQVQSTGNAAVPIGNGNYLRFQQRRESVTSAPPS